MSIVHDQLTVHLLDMQELERERSERDAISTRRAQRAISSFAQLCNAVETALLHLQGEPADQLRAALEDAAGGA